MHVVDASNPFAEEHVKAVTSVLEELGCGDKMTLLVMNKLDQMDDRSYVEVLRKHHPRSVAVSAATREGLQDLNEAVIKLLGNQFIFAEVKTAASNGKVLAFLNSEAEIIHQEYRGEVAVVRCRIPRHLLRHIEMDGVRVRDLDKEVGDQMMGEAG